LGKMQNEILILALSAAHIHVVPRARLTAKS
jgi:hypothetical protein